MGVAYWLIPYLTGRALYSRRSAHRSRPYVTPPKGPPDVWQLTSVIPQNFTPSPSAARDKQRKTMNTMPPQFKLAATVIIWLVVCAVKSPGAAPLPGVVM